MSVKAVKVSANAKINLYLNVTSKRTDGYHNIESVMQTLDLCDDIEVRITDSDGIHIKQNFINSDLPCDCTNLCYKAADAYLKYFGIDNVFIDISVIKNIPQAAGLAGGSADAAAVIRALDILFGFNTSAETLCKIGLDVGSDVPFCIMGGTCKVTGRGEIVERIARIPGYAVLVAKSLCESVSTGDAYKLIDEQPYSASVKSDFDFFVGAVNNGDCAVIENGMYNIFQRVMSYRLPETMKLIEEIKKNGAVCAMMSGSGPSVFALFENAEDAQKAAKKLSFGYFTAVCEPYYPEYCEN